MIDFHNHVLPAVDDGSKSLEMSLSMLKHAADQGITDVVNTVHFQHPKVEMEDISIERILEETKRLQQALDNASIPVKIHMGSEVFYLPNLVQLSDHNLATMGNGKYMLIEFQPHQIPEGSQQELFNLKMAGVTPIIAHPERYKPVQENIDIVRQWLRAGCLIQLDAGSVLGLLGPDAEKSSHEILQKHLCQLMGYDAHNNRKRNFCLFDAIEYSKTIVDESFLDGLLNNGKKVINGEEIAIEFDEMTHSLHKSIWKKIGSRLGLG